MKNCENCKFFTHEIRPVDMMSYTHDLYCYKYNKIITKTKIDYCPFYNVKKRIIRKSKGSKILRKAARDAAVIIKGKK